MRLRLAASSCAIALTGLWLAVAVSVPTATAGPATYDKATRSFRFTYTFAALPGSVGSVVGTVQKPSPIQEARVKGLVGRVSDVLYQVTDGRGKIGQLDYVDDIKNADLVVSLTGRPASPGWATQRATGGKPGQIVLYYQSLEGRTNVQDVIFTAAHEICHYVFGLADEYDPRNFPGGCPPSSGPGCLMDNYNAAARGFYGRLCLATDHNTAPTQRESCKAIVDRFFAEQGVTADPSEFSTDPAAIAAQPDPRTPVITSAIAQVKAERLEKLRNGLTSTSGLRTFARNTLLELVKSFNAGNPEKILLGAAERAVVDRIVNASLSVPPPKPSELRTELFEKIRAQAERFGTEFQSVTSESSRKSRIRSALLRFLGDLVKQGMAPPDFTSTERSRLAEVLAADVARSPEVRSQDSLLGIARSEAQLNLSIAEDVLALLDEQGAPGIRIKREFLNRIRSDLLENYGIVGRDSNQFGLRRTRIITPDPIYGDLPILTQGGVYSYSTIRDESTLQFSRMISRSKIQLVRPTATGGGGGSLPLNSRIEQPFGALLAAGPNLPNESNRVDILDVLADTIDQIGRDRLENIIILVPPGGLPSEVARQIPLIRNQFGSALRTIRLDLVLVGAVQVDTELRDAVVDSRGSVLTITDVDEIGAIAQRLKNEQSSGSWVIVPQQGYFEDRKVVADEVTPEPTPESKLLIQIRNLGIAPGVADPAGTTPDHATNPPASTAPNPQGGMDSLQDKEKILNAINGLDGYIKKKQQCVEDPALKKKIDEARSTFFALARNLRTLNDATQKLAARLKDGKLGQSGNSTDPVVLRDDPILQLLQGLQQARGSLLDVRRLLAKTRRTQNPNSLVQQFAALVRSLDLGGEDLENSGLDLTALGQDFDQVEELIRRYEDVLETAYLVTGRNVPIYQRVDRDTIQEGRRSLDLAGIERQIGSAIANRLREPPHGLRLPRFYAEGNAHFELILGLSRDLPLGGIEQGRSDGHPKLTLVSDTGLEVGETAKFHFDEATSSPSLLVWRNDGATLSEGWYTPVVTFEPDVFKSLSSQKANFTFSVGSDRANVQLIPGLVQGADTSSSGTLNRSDGPAVIEVQVSAGSSILGAQIAGYYQEIAANDRRIDFREVTFRDDGTDASGFTPENPAFDKAHCDRAANDGVYTTFIPLLDIDRYTEFRVFVQADTTDGAARYIGLDDPNRDDGDITQADADPRDQETRMKQRAASIEAEGRAIKIQRATSVHFAARP